ncbi:ras-related protein Rab-12 isoform X1 [Passer montanus]|uniref:ras-related protein Rab-12 isoform X1 n=1 Tax=Passer montanus TaxID=9160 RepID=UPI00195FDCD7|nr:ras-related protein Rab-12 isoform X1 [Passer montanus]
METSPSRQRQLEARSGCGSPQEGAGARLTPRATLCTPLPVPLRPGRGRTGQDRPSRDRTSRAGAPGPAARPGAAPARQRALRGRARAWARRSRRRRSSRSCGCSRSPRAGPGGGRVSSSLPPPPRASQWSAPVAGRAGRERGAAACIADGAGLGAAAAQGGGRRAGPRGGLGGGVAGALGGAVPPQEAAAAPGRLQAAGDHHRVAGGGQDQPYGAIHRRHLLRGLQVHRGDTAGQERFNSITSAYYRSAKGIILVYDITKKETFDDLPKWMKMIDKYASEDAELLLVGNKLDCEVDREISRQQGEKFAQQITGMRFCEASAKDNFNVDEIFLKLVDDILKKMPLDVIRNELSNSILSLQPEPEIPPELPPPRPHVRCC